MKSEKHCALSSAKKKGLRCVKEPMILYAQKTSPREFTRSNRPEIPYQRSQGKYFLYPGIQPTIWFVIGIYTRSRRELKKINNQKGE